MVEHQVLQQIKFESLDDFIRGQNKYYAHFLDDCQLGHLHRTTDYFKRFQETHPEMERELTSATILAVRSEPRQRLPYEQLWEAYKIMSNLVFVEDIHLIENESNEDLLIR